MLDIYLKNYIVFALIQEKGCIYRSTLHMWILWTDWAPCHIDWIPSADGGMPDLQCRFRYRKSMEINGICANNNSPLPIPSVRVDHEQLSLDWYQEGGHVCPLH
uniref:Uncharacterized protein n=1 Tax=Sphaerodactylus townsendi TaxID=933632 RepID=A0ACB8FFC4_9SAUR